MFKKRYLVLSDTDTPGDDTRSRNRWPSGEPLDIVEGPTTFIHDRHSIIEPRVRWQHRNNNVHTQPTGLRIRTTLDWTNPHHLIKVEPYLDHFHRLIGGVAIPIAPAEHDETTGLGIYYYFEVRVREARDEGELTMWSAAALYPLALTKAQSTLVTAELDVPAP